ncbi:MAG: hypothetical protein HQ522_04740 [Bacteroidetes bacterium]|nr:hypothetical protein [Bacteroidota bacterium]
MEIQYQIIKENNLLIQKFIGSFSIEFFAIYIDKLIENQEWKYITKVLTDCRETNFETAFKNLDKMSRIRTEAIGGNILNILLVDKPVTTAVAHLYIDKLKKYDYEYCSTLDYALVLLELNEYKNEIEDLLMNLKNRI